MPRFPFTPLPPAPVPAGLVVDARTHGATGDGVTLDTTAINTAISAVASAGGGTVLLPAGTYHTFSVRLASRVTLYLDAGATLLAANPDEVDGSYDEPEPNAWDAYQDFGHSHWCNSLVWGIGLEDVAIMGPGLIDGRGLTRRGPGPRRAERPGDTPLSLGGLGENAAAVLAEGEAAQRRASGIAVAARRDPDDMSRQGNKAIALRDCRRVTLRDFSILRGGHFAILPTGVDDFTLENLRVDTNRDGINIDCCRRVRMHHCAVNTVNDDGIVLKSSYALGEARPTADMLITECAVSGFDLGSMLDGTYRRQQTQAPDLDGPTGRIKFGTESNGGFQRITVRDCTFERCRGLAIEGVDGGPIEDVLVERVTLHEINNSPLFIRLGNRARGPEGTPVAAVRRITFRDVVATDVDPRFPTLFAGLVGHPVEDVTLERVRLVHRGGGTSQDAAREVPENANAYPEPSMFGVLPSYGLYVRHARGIVLRDVEFCVASCDARPAVHLDDVHGVRFERVRIAEELGGGMVEFRNTTDVVMQNLAGLPDTNFIDATALSL